MVHKSGDHHVEVGSLSMFIPIIYKVFIHPTWLFGISEPSTVGYVYVNLNGMKYIMVTSLIIDFFEKGHENCNQ